MYTKRTLEAVLVGAMGAGLGYLFLVSFASGWVVVAGAVVAGLNGVVGGAVGVYSWHKGKGWLFFLLDSTWGLFGNLLALLIHAANRVVGRGGYVLDM